jgi:DNA recombination protein RmuC
MINKLYDKYVGFTENFVKIGKKIEDAGDAFKSAQGQLATGAGNISGWFEKIKKKSGITTNKNIAITFDGNDDE